MGGFKLSDTPALCNWQFIFINEEGFNPSPSKIDGKGQFANTGEREVIQQQQLPRTVNDIKASFLGHFPCYGLTLIGCADAHVCQVGCKVPSAVGAAQGWEGGLFWV